MIIFMFKAILGFILFTCMMIVQVGCLWVLKIMLNELLTDKFVEILERWVKNGRSIVEGLRQQNEKTGIPVATDTVNDSPRISQGKHQQAEVHCPEEEAGEGAGCN